MTTSSARSLAWLITAWYLIVMIASGALLIVQQVLGIDADYLSIVQFAPAFGVLAVMLVLRARTRSVAPAAVNGRRMTARLAVGIVVGLAYAGVVAVVCATMGTLRHEWPFSSPALLLVYAALQLIGAFGEELGWRGFLQPALETRMPRLAACLVTGLLWALWHVQMFSDPLTAVGFTISVLAFSIMLGYVSVGSRWQRGIIAGVMHAIVNIAMFLIADPGQFVVAAAPLSLVLLIPFGAVLVWKRRNLHAALRGAASARERLEA